MIYLFFNTESAAQQAIAQIDQNMNLPDGDTITWAVCRLANDNTWGFAKPEQQHMQGVTDYTEAVYDYQTHYYKPEEY